MSYSNPTVTNTHGVAITLTTEAYQFHYLLSASDDMALSLELPTAKLDGFLKRHRLRSLHDVDCTVLLAECN